MAGLFGNLTGWAFKTTKAQKKDEERQISFVVPDAEDAVNITDGGASGGLYNPVNDYMATTISDSQMIERYRGMALHPEVDTAIDEIVNEVVVSGERDAAVEVILDEIDDKDLPKATKERIREEFHEVLDLLQFQTRGYDLVRRWYIDGRLIFHKVVDTKQAKAGIVELRYICPTKIRKIREFETIQKDGVKHYKLKGEYYEYTDNINMGGAQGVIGQQLIIQKDAIVYVSSGVLDTKNRKAISYLQKAVKPVNQLRMMEDSLVIYRISRAPERRIFYVDVGHLPKPKAEQYVREMMNRFRNRMVYNAQTGEIAEESGHISMLEDFWMPRREGGKGTEITTLQGGQNLGEIDDIIYFQKKLYRSLNVPISRMENEGQFSLGRASEITRDELKFSRFVTRLRAKFSELFFDLLKTQVVLKGILKEEEWDDIEGQIYFDFLRDSHFTELKDMEILSERLQLLNTARDYIGKYFSHEFVQQKILYMTNDEMERNREQIEKEKKDPRFHEEDDSGRF